MNKNAIHSLSIIARTIKLLWGFAPGIIIGYILISVISGALVPIRLMLTKLLLDALTTSLSIGKLGSGVFLWVVLSVCMGVISNLVSSMTTYLNDMLTDRISINLTNEILSRCSELPLSVYDNKETYNKIQFATLQSPSKITTLVAVFQNLLRSVVTFIGAFSLIFSTGKWIALVCVVTAIPAYLINKKINKEWYTLQFRRVESMRFVEFLKGFIVKNENLKELKLFDIMSFLQKRINTQQEKIYAENKQERTKITFVNAIYAATTYVVSGSMKVWAIALAIIEGTTIGTVNLLLTSIDSLQSTVLATITQLSSLLSQTLYLNTLFEILDIPRCEDSDGLCLEEAIDEIVFDNVSFKYPNSQTYAVKNVSLTMKRGKTYALLGLNGSGKTTLLKLVMKLYNPTAGHIYINGLDISKINGKSLRNQMSAVFQDFIKYPLSVAENIAFQNGEKEDLDSSIEKAANKATADSFIKELPEGYKTQLQKEWTGGQELSLGQWQKIAIARCFYKTSTVCIFDEPFSALDAISEEKIVRSIQEQKDLKIQVFITHRYSSLCLSDHIFVMEAGRIIGSGSHTQLFETCPAYAHLIKTQIDAVKQLESM